MTENPKISGVTVEDVKQTWIYRVLTESRLVAYFLLPLDGAVPFQSRMKRYEYSLDKVIQNALAVFSPPKIHMSLFGEFWVNFGEGINKYMDKYPEHIRIPDFSKNEEGESVAELKGNTEKLHTILVYYFMNEIHGLEEEALKCSEILYNFAGELGIEYVNQLLHGVFDYPWETK